MEHLTADMSDRDLRSFKASVRYVAGDFSGTIAGVSVLTDDFVRVRLSHPDFDRLVPTGHRLVTAIMEQHRPKTSAEYADFVPAVADVGPARA
jgi:hypothetical protein